MSLVGSSVTANSWSAGRVRPAGILVDGAHRFMAHKLTGAAFSHSSGGSSVPPRCRPFTVMPADWTGPAQP